MSAQFHLGRQFLLNTLISTITGSRVSPNFLDELVGFTRSYARSFDAICQRLRKWPKAVVGSIIYPITSG